METYKKVGNVLEESDSEIFLEHKHHHIIKLILKIIEKFQIFRSHIPIQNFLIESSKRALTHWKGLVQKLPKEINQTIDKSLKGEVWLNTKEMDKLNLLKII